MNSGICSRALLKQHDPQLASVLFKVFGDRDWRYPQTAPKPWPAPLAPYQRCLKAAPVFYLKTAPLHLPVGADQSHAGTVVHALTEQRRCRGRVRAWRPKQLTRAISAKLLRCFPCLPSADAPGKAV